MRPRARSAAARRRRPRAHQRAALRRVRNRRRPRPRRSRGRVRARCAQRRPIVGIDERAGGVVRVDRQQRATARAERCGEGVEIDAPARAAPRRAQRVVRDREAFERRQVLEERIAGRRHVHDVAGIAEQAEQVRVAFAGSRREHDVLGRDARAAARVVRGDRGARREVAARDRARSARSSDRAQAPKEPRGERHPPPTRAMSGSRRRGRAAADRCCVALRREPRKRSARGRGSRAWRGVCGACWHASVSESPASSARTTRVSIGPRGDGLDALEAARQHSQP